MTNFALRPAPRRARAAVFTATFMVAIGVTAGVVAAMACTAALAKQRTPAPAPASAPQTPATPQALSLEGTSFDGRRISLAERRGKVVVLYFWSTTCPVCRDKLPELRSNAAGWHNQPFEVITVSMDKRRADAVAYQQATDAVLRPEQRFATLWHGDANYRDNLPHKAERKLPYTVVLDREGRVVKTFEGRIPAEAWDTIAELLP